MNQARKTGPAQQALMHPASSTVQWAWSFGELPADAAAKREQNEEDGGPGCARTYPPFLLWRVAVILPSPST